MVADIREKVLAQLGLPGRGAASQEG
jgi:hypothetical protein